MCQTIALSLNLEGYQQRNANFLTNSVFSSSFFFSTLSFWGFTSLASVFVILKCLTQEISPLKLNEKNRRLAFLVGVLTQLMGHLMNTIKVVE